MSVRPSIAHAFIVQARWTAVSRVGGGPVARTTVGLLHRLMTAVLGQGIDTPGTQPSTYGLDSRVLDGRVSTRALCRRLARGVPGCVKLRDCGLPVPVGRSVNSSATQGSSFVDENPGVSRVLTVDGRLVGGQLMVCRSPLRCAWCSPLQWGLIEAAGLRFVAAHEAVGGWFIHSTLTVPHRRRDDLAVLHGWLLGAWRRVGRCRPLNALRKRLGVVACMPVFHCTWSPRSGWHPHLHLLWFLRGDESGFEEFSQVLAGAWRDRVNGLSGRVVGIAGTDAVLVRQASGVLKYEHPDDDGHPKNNCADPDHGGCWSCDPGGLSLLGDDISGGDLSGDDWSGSWGLDARPGLEVFSGLGPAAVRGNREFQALLAEYIRVLPGERRLISGWRALRAVYGPLDEVDSPRLTVVDGERLWVSAKLFRQVELCAHRKARSLLHEGLRTARDGSPFDAARLWELVLGVPVVAGFNADGDPLLRLGAEVEQVQGRLEIPTSEGVLV